MAAKRKPTRRTSRPSAPRRPTPRQSRMDYVERYDMSTTRPGGTSKLLIALVVLMAIFCAFLFWKVQKLETGNNAVQQLDDTQPPRPTELKIVKPSTNEHWRGDKNAQFVMVEYSDLECPFCKSAHPTLVKLLSENQGKVAWVFRHFPLSFHPKAQKASEAVECAADQGGDDAFWKLTDAIYEKMPELELTAIPDLAAENGLDAVALKECMDSGKHEAKVKAQQDEGSKAGVQATPSTVIYNMSTGKNLLVEGAVPEAEFRTMLKDFMKK